MPGSTSYATPAALVKRPRFVRSRSVEKSPPRHGEKPYEQLVAAAFDGPVLRLSQKMKLLEEADNRKIRRGDAIDLIAATQRELEARHAVTKPGKLEIFARRYAVFTACYMAFALIWCVVMARSSSGVGSYESQAHASVAGFESQVNAASINPPLDDEQR